MELSSPREAVGRLAIQEIPKILWNPKVPYRLHKSSPMVPLLNPINLVHTTPSYLSKYILILSSHLRPGVPSGLSPSGFPTNILYAFLFSPFVLHAPSISSSLI
jgi:hypothetical protein